MFPPLSSRPHGADRSGPAPHPISHCSSWRLEAVAAMLLLLSVGLGLVVAGRDASSFDRYWLQAGYALRAARPDVSELMRDLSGLGSMVALTLVTVIAVGYLALRGAWRSAVLLAGATLSGSLLVSLLKNAFGRLRPEAINADMVLASFSFPSGHASMSAVVYLMLGAWGASRVAHRAERVYVWSAAALMTLLIGLSRVVLGVHWATDVLGGWAFGTAWALAWLMLDERTGRR